MNDTCGCCEGLEVLTPRAIANRPGLDALTYRVGDRATFLESMKARLSSRNFPALANLKTRHTSDPAIAWLDAWATVADVLTFYQERIANEGYLRTATERRSVLELARLVGYTLRPGVAATVYPAFTMEAGFNKGSEIPAGTRIQSLPGAGEMPQFFETAETITARADWNNLKPRQTQPQYFTQQNATTTDTLYVEGIFTNLQPNDPMLLVFGKHEHQQVFRQVQNLETQANQNRTKVDLQLLTTTIPIAKLATTDKYEGSAFERLLDRKFDFNGDRSSLIDRLLKPPSHPPANAQRLGRTVTGTFTPASDIAPQLLATLKPELKDTLYSAWKGTQLTPPSKLQSVEALRVKAAPFGHNAPLKPVYDNQGRVIGYEEWAIAGTITLSVNLFLVSAIEGSSNFAFLVSRETFLQALIAIAQGTTTASTQIPLTTQNLNFDVSLGQNKVRVAILPLNRIRLIHALPSRGKLDLYIDERVVATGISRFDTSDYLGMTAIASVFQIKLAGQQDTLLSRDLQANGAYTIIATGAVDNPLFPAEELNIVDDGDDIFFLESGQARVRVFNASPDTFVTATLSDLAAPLARDLAFRSSSNYTLFNASTYDLSLTLSNGQTLIRENVKFESETVYDIVLVGLTSGTPELDVKIFDAPSLLPHEGGRFVFKFLQLEQEFRFIVDNVGLVAQVANKKVLTSRFAVNQTLRYSSEESTVTIANPSTNNFAISEELPSPVPLELRKVLALDAQYDRITPNSWVAIERSNAKTPNGRERLIRQVNKVETISKTDYGLSAKVTQLTLNKAWLQDTDRSLSLLRQTTVYAQSEELKLAEEAIDPEQEPIQGDEIELDILYDGLEPGRWAIVSGDRVDLGGTTGVKASELVMLSGVRQGVKQISSDDNKAAIDLPNDTTHTFIQLATPLAYKYKRDTVTIYGNVVKATHGETRTEILGSGDSSQVFQQFMLRQPPLTYVAAPILAGAASTLELRVNDLLWHETDSLVELQPTDRKYITRTDDEDKTTVIFGNRLPTGVENVRAVYRNGIGKAGNVKAEQIGILTTRPLGVSSVINPLPATGGADRESRDRARRNAPLAVMSLDRLVSVQDYADFARTFAGIGKASAARLSDGRRELVHVTIAGANDIPIDRNSDLYRNLLQALHQFGDPHQFVRVERRELVLPIIIANVRIALDYQWESVEPKIRAALLETFSFERRELGQSLFLSEVIGIVQQISGVVYVDVDVLASVSESEATAVDEKGKNQLVEKLKQLSQSEDKPKPPAPYIRANLARINSNAIDPAQRIQPAQLAFLSPEIADTLILQELKP
jgi:predicted phage baseplate assembly protein